MAAGDASVPDMVEALGVVERILVNALDFPEVARYRQGIRTGSKEFGKVARAGRAGQDVLAAAGFVAQWVWRPEYGMCEVLSLRGGAAQHKGHDLHAHELRAVLKEVRRVRKKCVARDVHAAALPSRDDDAKEVSGVGGVADPGSSHCASASAFGTASAPANEFRPFGEVSDSRGSPAAGMRRVPSSPRSGDMDCNRVPCPVAPPQERSTENQRNARLHFAKLKEMGARPRRLGGVLATTSFGMPTFPGAPANRDVLLRAAEQRMRPPPP